MEVVEVVGCSMDDTTSSGMSSQSGSAAGDPAASISMGTVAEVGSEVASGRDLERPQTPWNEFQHANKGRGLNSKVLSKIYKDHNDQRF